MDVTDFGVLGDQRGIRAAAQVHDIADRRDLDVEAEGAEAMDVGITLLAPVDELDAQLERRLRLADVLAYKQQRQAESRELLRQMREEAEDLELYV